VTEQKIDVGALNGKDYFKSESCEINIDDSLEKHSFASSVSNDPKEFDANVREVNPEDLKDSLRSLSQYSKDNIKGRQAS
jgi:predicted transposase YbfD/YdcC